MPKTIARIRLSLNILLTTASATLMLLLVCAVTWQVFSRYVMNQPSTQTDELARFLLIWLVLIGASYCCGTRKHLAIDLLEHALPARTRRWAAIYVDATVMTFAGWVMGFGGYRMIETLRVSQETSPAMQLPMSIVYLALPLSGAAIVIYCVLGMIESLLGSASSKTAHTEVSE